MNETPLKIVSVVGARPNFMKIAPFVHAINAHNAAVAETTPDTLATAPIEHYLVHTGQHYDQAMSESFFEALGIPKADIDLGIGSGSHAEQVGKTMISFEKVLQDRQPDWVIVVGDVNATCACSITAKKEHVKLAHIEAGLRSFDLDMPEEINRMVTDRLSDILFTPDEIADANLRAEGTAPERIKRVGNIMIDTLESHRADAESLQIADILAKHGINPAAADPTQQQAAAKDGFATLTIHRPSNVDSKETLQPLIRFFLDKIAPEMPIVWPIHPRTRKNLERFDLLDEVHQADNILLLTPVGYLEMLKLNIGSRIMLTDSGGLQEECCVLGTPCLTLRWNTERPKTLTEHDGVSVLVGNDIARISVQYEAMKDLPGTPHRPELWDGHTARRIVKILAESAVANR